MTDKNIAKKEKAIELMKRLSIYKPYIKGFRESDKVCFFEGFGGFWIDQKPEVYAKMKVYRKEIRMPCLCRNARIYTVRRMLLLPYRIGLSRRMGRLNER